VRTVKLSDETAGHLAEFEAAEVIAAAEADTRAAVAARWLAAELKASAGAVVPVPLRLLGALVAVLRLEERQSPAAADVAAMLEALPGYRYQAGAGLFGGELGGGAKVDAKVPRPGPGRPWQPHEGVRA
jgi:hypothetical protein